MARVSPRRSGRLKGATVVILAAMLPVVIGGLALSVDTAVLATARAQLSTVADASALAGARKLATEARLKGGDIGGADITAAQEEAHYAAERNSVLGEKAVLLLNASNSNSGTEDIVVGYIDRPADPDSPLSTDSADMLYANTVKVTARRDASHSGVVPRFFSKLWGDTSKDMYVTSAATVKGFVGFKYLDGVHHAQLLPIVLDEVSYEKMLAKASTDEWTVNPGSEPTPGGDGIFEAKLFPVTTGSSGNWGTVNIGVESNSTSNLRYQISNGIKPEQLAKYPDGMVLDQENDPPSMTFTGDTGISAAIESNLIEDVMDLGKPVRIPIYREVNGPGNNAVYTIVAFAPVYVLAVELNGSMSNKHVILQPADVQIDDPTGVWSSVKVFTTEEFKLSLTR